MTSLNRALRPKQAAACIGVGLSTFWRYAQTRPDFPKLIRLSPRATVAIENELIAWRDGPHADVPKGVPVKKCKKASAATKDTAV